MQFEPNSWAPVCVKYSVEWFKYCGPISVTSLTNAFPYIITVLTIPLVIIHSYLLAKKKASIVKILFWVLFDILTAIALIVLFANIMPLQLISEPI